MINLKIKKKVQWNIVAGIFLLIFAFFIIFTSNDNKTSENTLGTTSQENKTTVTTSMPEDVLTETMPAETTTVLEEMTAESITEKIITHQNAKDLINFDAEYPFMIRVNRAENFAVVYGIDKNGRHTIPYKAFICSTGLEEGSTPLGVFEMSDKYRWRLMVDGTYAQYAIRIEGQIMLHSVPYSKASADTLEYWEYNKLGKPASLGCVRFRAAAIKWIYNNCKPGTKVNIYSEPGEESPIPLKKITKIKNSNSNSGWDPTDPDKDNPWKSKKNSSKKKGSTKTNKSNKTDNGNKTNQIDNISNSTQNNNNN